MLSCKYLGWHHKCRLIARFCANIDSRYADNRLSATNITYAVTGVIVVGAVMLDVLKKKNAAKVKVDPAEKKAAEKQASK